MKYPFWAIALVFALAELGDKTMLATLALAANHSVLPVLIGSTAGLLVADAIAVVVGGTMGKQLPVRPIRIGAACVFLAVGVWYLLQGSVGFSSITRLSSGM
jgi:putative Ca2+/H+ antiporter (TMEM165/GDT1 family)